MNDSICPVLSELFNPYWTVRIQPVLDCHNSRIDPNCLLLAYFFASHSFGQTTIGQNITKQTPNNPIISYVTRLFKIIRDDLFPTSATSLYTQDTSHWSSAKRLLHPEKHHVRFYRKYVQTRCIIAMETKNTTECWSNHFCALNIESVLYRQDVSWFWWKTQTTNNHSLPLPVKFVHTRSIVEWKVHQ